jgi:hypothetical protein
MNWPTAASGIKQQKGMADRAGMHRRLNGIEIISLSAENDGSRETEAR